MDYIMKLFKDRCKTEFLQFGFKAYKNNYFRVVNDVFQSFHLHKSITGNECTVEFAIIPLCAGEVIKKESSSANHLKMFEDNYSWFGYEKNDEKSVEGCVSRIVEYMKKYLLPHFARASNSEDAYYEILSFQEKHYKKGVFFADYYLFCMALKAGLYAECVNHLDAIIKHTANAYKVNRTYADGGLSEAYENEVMARIKKLEYQKRMISEINEIYIKNFIMENEKKALINLGVIKTQRQ